MTRNKKFKRVHFYVSDMKKLIFILCFFIANIVCNAGTIGDTRMPLKWRAGYIISGDEVRKQGIDRCFTSSNIDKTIFERIKGHSYRNDCTVPLKELRYLRVLHYDADGNIRMGEMICNRAISTDLLNIFRELYNTRYPIERMVLIDEYGADDERSMTANNSTCFNFRAIAGSKKLSNHSLGRAVDINPLYNPHVRRSNGRITMVNPKAARPYADRSKKFKMKIDREDLCYRLFIKHGFKWGGNWRTAKDYQHFEK